MAEKKVAAKITQPTFVNTSVNLRGLRRVGARPPFLDYLVALWDYRHFIAYDARARVQSGNERDKLGNIWLILTPALNGLTFFLIFHFLLQSGRGIENFVAYLIIGVFLFQMSTRAVNSSARSITGNKNVIHAFNFPRATLVVATNVRELLSNIPVLLTMLVLVIVIPPVEAISWKWLMLVPIVGLQFLFNLGLGFIVARLVSAVNDLAQLLRFATRLWMYASCVFFSINRFDAVPAVKTIMELNPLYNVLYLARECVLYGSLGSWQSWAVLTAWALLLLVFGTVFFWKGEETYGREL